MKKQILIVLALIVVLSMSVMALEVSRTVNGNNVELSLSNVGSNSIEIKETLSGATIVAGSYPNSCGIGGGGTVLTCAPDADGVISYQTAGAGTVSGTVTGGVPPTFNQVNLVIAAESIGAPVLLANDDVCQTDVQCSSGNCGDTVNPNYNNPWCCPANYCYGDQLDGECVAPGTTATYSGSNYVCQAGSWGIDSSGDSPSCSVDGGNANVGSSLSATICGARALEIGADEAYDKHFTFSGKYGKCVEIYKGVPILSSEDGTLKRGYVVEGFQDNDWDEEDDLMLFKKGGFPSQFCPGITVTDLNSARNCITAGAGDFGSFYDNSACSEAAATGPDCGNKILDTNEECDSTEPNNAAAMAAQCEYGGYAVCVSCEVDTGTCSAPPADSDGDGTPVATGFTCPTCDSAAPHLRDECCNSVPGCSWSNFGCKGQATGCANYEGINHLSYATVDNAVTARAAACDSTKCDLNENAKTCTVKDDVAPPVIGDEDLNADGEVNDDDWDWLFTPKFWSDFGNDIKTISKITAKLRAVLGGQ